MSPDCVLLQPLFNLDPQHTHTHTQILNAKGPSSPVTCLLRSRERANIRALASGLPPLDQSSTKAMHFLHACSSILCVYVSFQASGEWAWSGQQLCLAKVKSGKVSNAVDSYPYNLLIEKIIFKKSLKFFRICSQIIYSKWESIHSIHFQNGLCRNAC